MVSVIRANLGSHVPIRVRARERRSDSENGRFFALNAVRLSGIDTPSGTAIAVASIPAFRHVTDSEMVALWDTSALTTPGDYRAKVEAVTGYDTVARTRVLTRKDVIIRLVKQGAP